VHRLNRRVATLMTLAVVMSLGLAACGDDDEDTEAGQTTPTTAPAPRGSDTVTIEMTDHAYTVSGPLNAGGTLRISNPGKEFHVLAMARFKPGKTIQDLQTTLQQLAQQGGPGGGGGAGGGETTTTTARGGTTTTSARGGTTTTSAAGGGAAGGEEQEQDPLAELFDGEPTLPSGFMSPGETVEVTVPNLQPGTYGLICFVPTEGEGTPHFAKGMVSQLEVVAGPAPAQPTADATYRLAAGQAVQGPATLTPGRHTLRFEAAPGSQQLEPAIARLNPGTTPTQFDAALTRLFESEEPPPRNAAGQVPGQVVFAGLDLQDTSAFYITADFRAGNYVIVAEDTDVEDRPSPPREIHSVRVA
jgi:hypothetical protein